MTTEATETTSSAAGPGRGGRMSRRRKREAVLRLLRGEDLETVSRSLGVTAATLSGWRDACAAVGEASLATLYLSWDTVSWHISKRLHRRVEEHNAAVLNGGGPTVETAPLPSGAQFVNVIEPVFSGMARSIIHDSDYKTLDDAKTAIEWYFAHRNAHITQHPRRAGKKIWGKERELPEFSEANNCKDPRYR